ncbi:MAG: hypothetical protein V2A64_04300 [Candidatus Omnitrophota bacterium]
MKLFIKLPGWFSVETPLGGLCARLGDCNG